MRSPHLVEGGRGREAAALRCPVRKIPIGLGRPCRPLGGQRDDVRPVDMASMVTTHVLDRTAVGLQLRCVGRTPFRQSGAVRLRIGGERAQAAPFPRREVAAVRSGTRSAHPGAMLPPIDQGQPGRRASGGFFSHIAAPRPAQDVDAVHREGAHHRVHDRREVGALLLSTERRPMTAPRSPVRGVVVHRNRGLPTDVQPLRCLSSERSALPCLGRRAASSRSACANRPSTAFFSSPCPRRSGAGRSSPGSLQPRLVHGRSMRSARAPLPQLRLAGTLDEVAPLEHPAPGITLPSRAPSFRRRRSGRRPGTRCPDRTEQLHRDLGAARAVDEEGTASALTATVLRVTRAALAQRLDAPAGLVAVAHRHLVLVREDRLGEGFEQRQKRGSLPATVPGALASPWSVSTPRPGARAEAGKTLEQNARDADPVGRPGDRAGGAPLPEDAQSQPRR